LFIGRREVEPGGGAKMRGEKGERRERQSPKENEKGEKKKYGANSLSINLRGGVMGNKRRKIKSRINVGLS